MFTRRKPTDTPQFRRAHGRNWQDWIRRLVTVTLIAGLAVWWFWLRPQYAESDLAEVADGFGICGQRSGNADGCVVDGDTVIIGFGKDRRRIRLTGYDAPELEGACQAEREMAIKARVALKDWLSRQPFQWDGGDAPPYDQYGRELREASRLGPDGKHEYLADVMIERGLASENGWGSFPTDWCS